MMRARVLAALACVVACLGIPLACSLNPQPLPPDNPDGSVIGMDGAGGGFDGGFGDANVPSDGAPTATDAEADTSVGTDAGDAGDAGADAAMDGGADAALDSSDDGAADAAAD